MALDILIVDDSPFFQRVLSEIINDHSQLNVVGVASNGRDAIDKVKRLKPDIVTMDYEMPMMDGVTAVRQIMSENPLPILMLSSMTFDGAKITIDALEAGAADFMTKDFAEISGKSSAIKARLYNTFLALGKSMLLSQRQPQALTKTAAHNGGVAGSMSARSSADVNTQPRARAKVSLAPATENKATLRETHTASKKDLFESPEKPKIVVIGASTGGPAALTELLKKIPKNFPYPIVVVQHMPENFTLAFSQRLDKQCQVAVKEAEAGDKLLRGRVLIAPGGKQLTIDKKDATRVNIIESSIDINYKPCVDVTFASLSNTYGKSALAIVLTGMGSDGCDGARLLKQQRATVWTQSESSCVVYGMPMAIDKANLSNASLSLDKIAEHLCSL